MATSHDAALSRELLRVGVRICVQGISLRTSAVGDIAAIGLAADVTAPGSIVDLPKHHLFVGT